MPKKSKNKEGKKIKTRSSQKKVSKSKRGLTLKGIEKKQQNDRKIQNLISALIIMSGLFVGSLFVDVMQLVSRSGYSERSLRNAEVFELGDKTWVAYNEPAIKVDILVADSDDDCPACNADDVLSWMKKFIPTMAINKVKESSPEGRALIEKYELKTIPSFVFDEKVQEAEFYQDEQVQEIFDRKEGGLVLNSASLGIPAGKYLEAPEEKSGDILIGRENAQVKLITFIDFESSYSKIFYEAVKEARNEFSADQLALVYKFYPSDLRGQAISAVLAGECAYQQGKFEGMADILIANQKEWAATDDFQIFDKYAVRIGLNKKAFDDCANSEDSRKLIQDSINQAENFGIAATPASFIKDEFLNGIFQKEDIVQTVNEKLGISEEEMN